MTRANLIALVVLLAGLLCHAIGSTYDSTDEQEIAHLAGGAFDLTAGMIAFVGRKKDGSGGVGPLGAIAVAAVLMTTSTGCVVNGPAPTDEQKLQSAERWITTAETSIMLAQATGKLDPVVASQLLEAGDVAHAAYQALVDKYTTGKPMDFDAALDAFNAAMRHYIEQLNAKGVEVKDAGGGTDRSGSVGVRADDPAVEPRTSPPHAERAPAYARIAAADSPGQQVDRAIQIYGRRLAA